MSNLVMQLSSVSKLFQDRLVIDNVSLKLFKGEVACLLGNNGSGKSTLINIMLGLSVPSAGKIRYCNNIPSKLLIGAALQDADFMQAIRVNELLKFVIKQYPSPLMYGDVLEMFSLNDVEHMCANQLSFGQKKLLALALAFAGDPDIVFLDEPTIGMDIISRHCFWSIIKRFATKQRLIVFTTHYLEEAKALASRILMLKNGKLVFDDSLSSDNENPFTKVAND